MTPKPFHHRERRDDGPGGRGARRPFHKKKFRPDARGSEKRGIPREGAEAPEDFIFGRQPVREALDRMERGSAPAAVPVGSPDSAVDVAGLPPTAAASPVSTAPGVINKLWVQRGAMGGVVQEIIGAARALGVVFQWVERDRLDQMLGQVNHQGVAARISPVAYGSLADLWAKGTPSPVVLLDSVTDPHNLGAIVRNAAFFGAAAVVVPRWRSAGITGAVMKASAGTLARVPLVQVANISQTMIEFKDKGYWVYGADMGGEPLPRAVMNTPTALVIGAEGEGLHRLVRERCDGIVSIPGAGGAESLNASCAAAVLLHDLFRRRVSTDATR